MNLALLLDTTSGPLTLDVRDFTVQAEMSRPYDVEVTAVVSDARLDLDGLVGRPAAFALAAGARTDLAAHLSGGAEDEGIRQWSGICVEARQVTSEETGLSAYRIRIAPPLWLLTQRTDIRIFQHLSELEIVLKVLARWGIEPVVLCDRDAHRRREYRTQYEETDFDFVNRMLEEAGISYYFETNHGQKGRMVLCDAPHRETPRERALTFQDSPIAAEGLEWASGIELVRRVAPGRVALVDHDFRRPTHTPLLATARGGLPAEQQLEMFEYRDGHFLFVQGDAGDPEDPGDRRGPARTDEKEASSLAEKRLRALRARARETHLETNAYDVDVGDVVRIEAHTRADLAEAGLLVTEITLTGSANGEWQLDAIGTSPAEPYRPPLRTPRPVASGVESATVVGPDPNKSHKDKHGRVFVHFHWDRDEIADEYTTCWMHVSQPWGGANWGAGMMPRPGQEVIVAFFGSDPDRPIVVGRYHTAIQKPPFKYPSTDEEGGIISWSDDGSGGSNKVTWKDRAGHELLNLQAQRDKQVLVKRNSGTTVRSNQSLAVGANRSGFIKGVDTKKVVGPRIASVGADQATAVQKNAFLQTNEGGITQSASTGYVTSAQGSLQTCINGQKFVVGKSAIVITGDLIMISSAKVLINPSPEDAESIINTGKTPAMLAEEERQRLAQADHQQRQQQDAQRRQQKKEELDRRQAEVDAMPLIDARKADMQRQIDRERADLALPPPLLDSPIFQPRPSTLDLVPQAPSLPQAPSIPQAPSLPQAPSIPQAPSLPQAPSIPQAPQPPSLIPTYQPRPFPY